MEIRYWPQDNSVEGTVLKLVSKNVELTKEDGISSYKQQYIGFEVLIYAPDGRPVKALLPFRNIPDNLDAETDIRCGDKIKAKVAASGMRRVEIWRGIDRHPVNRDWHILSVGDTAGLNQSKQGALDEILSVIELEG